MVVAGRSRSEGDHECELERDTDLLPRSRSRSCPGTSPGGLGAGQEPRHDRGPNTESTRGERADRGYRVRPDQDDVPGAVPVRAGHPASDRHLARVLPPEVRRIHAQRSGSQSDDDRDQHEEEQEDKQGRNHARE